MLKVDNLIIKYHEMVAIKNINIHVNEKEFVAIIGPNGAGKTTLLNSLAGLIPTTSGTAYLEGREITGLDSSDIVQSGFILCPEGRKLVNTMNVEENLLLGAYATKDDRVVKDLKVVYEIIPVLAERKKQQARTLSGGQQQMLAIGRSWMGKPKLLALDEPALGLAPLLKEEIGNKLVELHHHGASILLVEQNAMLALALAERCYVLEFGSISMEGSPSELKKDEAIREAYLGL